MGEIGIDENFGDKTGGDRPREHCTCIFIYCILKKLQKKG
jgi:hypothetical protein